MSELFDKMLNMSFKASVVVLVVIALRFLLKKAPKWIHCLLWGMVAIRLICPSSIDSPASFFNLVHSKPVAYGQGEYSQNTVESEKVNTTFEVPLPPEETSETIITEEQHKSGGYLPTLTVIWLIGVGAMIVYAVCSYTGIKRKVRLSINTEQNVFLCDDINTPFILGIISPRIYVPSSLTGTVYDNVLAHERAHIRRLDHWWKPMAFLLLSVYWLNPFMWLGYILFCKDIELACDEKVIHGMDKAEIASYSSTLLECSMKKRLITACPLAFGETAVKARIKSALSYKKPAFIAVAGALIVCIIAGVFFMTDSKNEATEETDSTKNIPGNLSDSSAEPVEGDINSVNANLPEEGNIDNAAKEQTVGKEIKTEEIKTEEIKTEDVNKTDEKGKAEKEIQGGVECELFRQMAGEYWFLSGAGGWQTRLYLNSDGSFTGLYEDHDTDTIHRCKFSGLLQTPMEINEYAYVSQILDLSYDEPGIETKEGEYTVISATPYGLEDTTSVYIFLPGYPISSLTMGEYSWLSAEREEFWYRSRQDAAGEVLPCYAIRNVFSNDMFTNVPEKYLSTEEGKADEKPE